jgi:hypothetical protein
MPKDKETKQLIPWNEVQTKMKIKHNFERNSLNEGINHIEEQKKHKNPH